MENLIKNIKKKLSVDNLVDMMKESKVIDENTVKEEDVRRTLQKIDPNSLMDVDELAAKLNEISEDIKKQNAADSSKPSKSAITKPTTAPEGNSCTENDFLRALNREENVFNLSDDCF